ncbi:MAG: polyphenol oxidase family protein [Patescibacteria group bacterium]|jgi:hypothetical protein
MIKFDEKRQQFYSTLIHTPHGFLTRNGTQNIPESITATNFYWVRQVHGNIVLSLNKEKDFGRVTTKEADGLVYKKDRRNKITVSVRTADCVPIIMEDSRRQIVGVVHSGWKGCNVNVAHSALDRFLSLGSKPQDIAIAIGPAIGSCCYNINPDREQILFDAFEESVENRENLVKFNLLKAVYTTLLQGGVSKEAIDWRLFCTKCQKDLFTSYRSEGRGVTNMISYISI